MKYKVGDTVRIRKDLVARLYGSTFATKKMIDYAGETAKITHVGYSAYELDIDNSRWYWNDDMFEPIEVKKIVITSDGKTTRARLFDEKKVIKETKCACSPNDEYDFMTGARIAFNRLDNEFAESCKLTQKKPYNGKMVCLDSKGFNMLYTKGKIYQWDNGTFICDNGALATDHIYHSFEEWNRASSVEWLEIVE